MFLNKVSWSHVYFTLPLYHKEIQLQIQVFHHWCQIIIPSLTTLVSGYYTAPNSHEVFVKWIILFDSGNMEYLLALKSML